MRGCVIRRDTDFQVDKGYDNGRWVFTGNTSDVAGQIKEIPNLPIVVMAEGQGNVTGDGSGWIRASPVTGGSARESEIEPP